MADANASSQAAAETQSAARETMEIIYGISSILGCDLSREALGTIVALLQSGVNPEALASAVKELRREKAKDALPPPALPK